MIARYTRPEMGQIWSDENKYRSWLTVEIAASEALARAGMVPQPAADIIQLRLHITCISILMPAPRPPLTICQSGHLSLPTA